MVVAGGRNLEEWDSVWSADIARKLALVIAMLVDHFKIGSSVGLADRNAQYYFLPIV